MGRCVTASRHAIEHEDRVECTSKSSTSTWLTSAGVSTTTPTPTPSPSQVEVPTAVTSTASQRPPSTPLRQLQPPFTAITTSHHTTSTTEAKANTVATMHRYRTRCHPFFPCVNIHAVSSYLTSRLFVVIPETATFHVGQILILLKNYRSILICTGRSNDVPTDDVVVLLAGWGVKEGSWFKSWKVSLSLSLSL